MGSFLSDQNLSKSTIKSYKICYKYYVNYLKKHDIIIAKTSDVIKFRESLRACGHSTYYIYLYISALRSLYRYLRIHQKKLNLSSAYTYDIMVPIKNEKIKKKSIKTDFNIRRSETSIDIYKSEPKKSSMIIEIMPSSV